LIGGEYGETEAGIPIERTVTVVEAVVVVHGLEDASDESELLSKAFDHAVNAVLVAQEAHQAVTSQPIALMTRETLPPLVPFARRRIDDVQVEAGEQPASPDALEVFLTYPPVAEMFRSTNRALSVCTRGSSI
jgi:hypothetical protein